MARIRTIKPEFWEDEKINYQFHAVFSLLVVGILLMISELSKVMLHYSSLKYSLTMKIYEYLK